MNIRLPTSRWARVSLVLVPLLVIWLIVRASSPTEVQSTPVVSVFPSQTLSLLNASGYVVAQRKAAISTKASGRLEMLDVTEGSRVKKGQLLARIESDELAAQLLQAEAQVGLSTAERDDARREYERAQSLLARNYISQAAFDASRARFEKAAAQLRSTQAAAKVARAALSQAEIRAPFDGVVLTKNANIGDNITPFSSAADSKGAVVTMADMSTLEVEADVSESSMAKISVGQPVEIGLDAIPNERFPGRVARMVPTIDRAKATRLVKLEFDQIDPRILPDMSAKVSFLERPLSAEERKPVVGVNRAAAIETDKGWRVWAIEDGSLRAIALAVPPGASDLVLTPGLKPGARVVLRPTTSLREGGRVKVVAP
jgi:HlyD family secretion protein